MQSMDAFFARTGNTERQTLKSHLFEVSKLAGEFAEEFGEKDWGIWLGLLHDIGKYSREFQERLHNPQLRVDHSTAGAREISGQIAARAVRPEVKKFYAEYLARLAAGILAGHHGGLPHLAGRFDKRCRMYPLDYSAWKSENALPPGLPPLPPKSRDMNALKYLLAFRTRMLFSCLVDADRLDAERYSSPEKAAARQAYASLEELNEAFEQFIAGKTDPHAPANSVNAIRNRILNDAWEAALMAPGFFRLTVPTGGGKTLSSLAFALRHALEHGKRRIIYVIPYTSIIEQTADVFRSAFGEQYADSVVEHHSNYAPPGWDETNRENLDDFTPPAWENWDAPIIVTTSVQFFESLHAAAASSARKIHNIANAVVILDEAQNLPAHLLRPCVKALDELARFYGTSVVLCTATQPALEVADWLPEGLEAKSVREICSDVPGVFAKLKRVTVIREGKLENDELAKRLLAEKKALCIVNTRRHARDLFEELKSGRHGNAGAGEMVLRHLSAGMHPQHRRIAVRRIRETLSTSGEGECLVVSTQLVEAGVDLDFPVVYRSLAGLDSIAQAAGRCNREGKLAAGIVHVFDTDKYKPVDDLGTRLAWRFFSNPENLNRDPLDPNVMRSYFEERYSFRTSDGLDREDILGHIYQNKSDFDFPGLQRDFRFIDNDDYPVIVPVEVDPSGRETLPAGRSEVEGLVETLRENLAGGIVPRTLLRRLQAFTVSLRKREFEALFAAGTITCLGSENTFPLLVNRDLYSPETGIVVDDPTAMKPETLIL